MEIFLIMVLDKFDPKAGIFPYVRGEPPQTRTRGRDETRKRVSSPPGEGTVLSALGILCWFINSTDTRAIFWR